MRLTDTCRAKDGDFFISDWLRNRNTVEFLGVWESVNNPNFNYGEFATIRSQVGLNTTASRIITTKTGAKMSNVNTPHSVELRRKTRAEHARRVKEHGVRVDVSLLDTDGSTYVQEMRDLVNTHGDAGKALRFLLDSYKRNK